MTSKKCINCYGQLVIKLYNIELFKKNNWEEYIKAVNDSNGQFKYRWGDIG